MNQQKHHPIQRIKHWVTTHRKSAILLAVVLTILLSGGIATAVYFANQTEETPAPSATVTPKPKPKPIVYHSPLTGSVVKDEAATKQAVTAIMIENSPDARPQSGLKDSGVVFEAIAEGGITRFLALYQNEKPGLVGPVRSLRMYYVDWLAPFNASVAHVGGSASALTEIRSGNYRDIDQFFNAGAYWRASDRYAPHNVYTSFERLDALNEQKGYTESNFTGFDRIDSKPATTPTASQINVTMSSPLYNSSYTYDPATNLYNRYQGGAAHIDREAGQISPRVVIVMKAPMARVFEDGYREQITTIGSGAAYIFQDGTVQEVTWNKPTRTSQINFTNAEGKKVALARGQTWISVVPQSTGGASWQ